jgi:hypothetical protein
MLKDGEIKPQLNQIKDGYNNKANKNLSNVYVNRVSSKINIIIFNYIFFAKNI